MHVHEKEEQATVRSLVVSNRTSATFTTIETPEIGTMTAAESKEGPDEDGARASARANRGQRHEDRVRHVGGGKKASIWIITTTRA